jgi:hypothetical protein
MVVTLGNSTWFTGMSYTHLEGLYASTPAWLTGVHANCHLAKLCRYLHVVDHRTGQAQGQVSQEKVTGCCAHTTPSKDGMRRPGRHGVSVWEAACYCSVWHGAQGQQRVLYPPCCLDTGEERVQLPVMR